MIYLIYIFSVHKPHLTLFSLSLGAAFVTQNANDDITVTSLSAQTLSVGYVIDEEGKICYLLFQ